MSTILITGANRGIGAEMARQSLAKGHTVIGTMREPATADLPDGVERIQLDVRKEAQHLLMAERLAGRAIDLVICNAGIFEGRGKIEDDGFDAAHWDASFATNVTGVFFTIRSLLPNLRLSDAGRIAVISSQMGSSTRAPGGGYIYRASKAAATNLAMNLATDLKPEGIAVGAYHPGWVQTDMGGGTADITSEQSASGLLTQFDALTLATTGCFKTYAGEDHPF